MKKLILSFILLFFALSIFATTPYSMKKVDVSGKYAKLVVTYPVFKEKSFFEEQANKWIYEKIKTHIERNKTFIEEYGDREGYINTAYATVIRADDKFISVLWCGDWNAGGVHNDIIYTATYGQFGDIVKIADIEDVYEPEQAANDIIAAYKAKPKDKIPQQIIEGVMTPKALLFEEGMSLLNNFVISDKYITFFREEYEFGYGYEGADFVKLPYPPKYK